MVDDSLSHTVDALAKRVEQGEQQLDALQRTVANLGNELDQLRREGNVPASQRSKEPSTTPQGHAQLHRVVAAVWQDHADEKYRSDMSHWRGAGRWADIELWERIGKDRLVQVKELLQRVHAEPKTDGLRLLEWGPGGGSNLLASSSIASDLYAVDISQKNLDESGRILKGANFDRYHPILLEGSISDAVGAIDHPIDVFLSTAVFQHFPSKQYGLDVLQAVSSKMPSGACGIVQIRYDNGNPKFAPKSVAEYSRGHITATSYAIDEFWDALVGAKFVPLEVRDINSRINYATFLFKKA